MNIISKKLEELKPYENNPRINDGAVEYVKNSIEEFGFKKDTIDDIFKEKSGKKTHIRPKCGHEWE